MRYDPHSRRYKHWVLPHDWDDLDLSNDEGFRYPRFTEEDGRKILRQIYRYGQVDPLMMGKDWNFQGPKVRNRLSSLERQNGVPCLLRFRDLMAGTTGSGKRRIGLEKIRDRDTLHGLE